MRDKCYKFQIRVTAPDKSQTVDEMMVSERDTRFGEAFALGKVVAFYDDLREKGTIKDYRIIY